MHPVYIYGETNEESHPIPEDLKQLWNFRPHLTKLRKYIQMIGKEEKDVKDIKLFLDVAKCKTIDTDIGMEAVRSYLRRIHEMSRKYPLPIGHKWEELCMQHNQKPYDNDDEMPIVSGEMKRQPLFQDPRIKKQARLSPKPATNSGGVPSWLRDEDDKGFGGFTQPVASHSSYTQLEKPTSVLRVKSELPPVSMSHYGYGAPRNPFALASVHLHPPINFPVYQMPGQHYPSNGPAHHPVMMPRQPNYGSPYNVSGHSLSPYYSAPTHNLEPNIQIGLDIADDDYSSFSKRVTHQRKIPFYRAARESPFNRDRDFNQSRRNTNQGVVKRVNLEELERPKKY